MNLLEFVFALQYYALFNARIYRNLFLCYLVEYRFKRDYCIFIKDGKERFRAIFIIAFLFCGKKEETISVTISLLMFDGTMSIINMMTELKNSRYEIRLKSYDQKYWHTNVTAKIILLKIL